MTEKIVLRGITWNHTRGLLPVAATAQRFAELHPGVEIVWEKRSLQEFADAPIDHLVGRYDLLVIDHPWAGFAASSGVLVDFNAALPKDFMEDQAANSVGPSHASYEFDGKQTALAIDAATPVASWRPDLLARAGSEVPDTWDDVLSLARRGMVAVPAIPIDSLMNFYMLCIALGEEPFSDGNEVASPSVGTAALESLRELTSLCPRGVFGCNPIRVYEALASGDKLAYCPFAYGYSNYSRPGYGRHELRFGDLVRFGDGGRLRSTLGGTGIAVSASSPHREIAVEYAAFTAAPETQRTLYVECGGQPGHRSAWLDDRANRLANGYFRDTLPALDRAYLRPRYNGYLHFQDHAGDAVHSYLLGEIGASAALARMNELYRESRRLAGSKQAESGQVQSRRTDG